MCRARIFDFLIFSGQFWDFLDVYIYSYNTKIISLTALRHVLNEICESCSANEW